MYLNLPQAAASPDYEDSVSKADNQGHGTIYVPDYAMSTINFWQAPQACRCVLVSSGVSRSLFRSIRSSFLPKIIPYHDTVELAYQGVLDSMSQERRENLVETGESRTPRPEEATQDMLQA